MQAYWLKLDKIYEKKRHCNRIKIVLIKKCVRFQLQIYISQKKTAFSNKNLKKKENFHMTEQQQQKYEEECAHFLKFHKAEWADCLTVRN